MPGETPTARAAAAVSSSAGVDYGTGAESGGGDREAPLSPEVQEDRAKIAALSQTRTWTDASGQFNFQGAFLDYSQGKVQLQRANSDQVITLPMTRLSDADKEFIRDGLRAKARERTREEQLRIRDLRRKIIGDDRQDQY